MKKIMVSLVIFSFLAGVMALRPAAAAERERILSPEQIKNYREIIKEGAALFGFKIEKSEKIEKPAKMEKKEEKRDEKREVKKEERLGEKSGDTMSTSTGERLEKIMTPAQIALFEKIRKVGTALWGVKKGDVRKSTSTPERVAVSAEISACVVAAIDVKDKAMIERVNVAAVEVTAAISARSVCQQAAVKSTERQGDNLGACVKIFQESLKVSRDKSKAAQKSAEETYRSSLKACRINTTATTATEIMIEDGSDDSLESVTE